MQNKIKSLLYKMEDVYKGDPWYGEPVKLILKNVNPKIVLKKVKKNAHSIAEVVTHMISWREFTLSRLTEDHVFKIEQEESFDWKRIDSNEKTVWQSLLDALERTQKEILIILEKSDDKLLDMPVNERSYKMEYLIEGIIQHDIYHTGQVSLVKKLIEDN